MTGVVTAIAPADSPRLLNHQVAASNHGLRLSADTGPVRVAGNPEVNDRDGSGSHRDRPAARPGESSG